MPGNEPAKRQVKPVTRRRAVAVDGSDDRALGRRDSNLCLKGLTLNTRRGAPPGPWRRPLHSRYDRFGHRGDATRTSLEFGHSKTFEINVNAMQATACSVFTN